MDKKKSADRPRPRSDRDREIEIAVSELPDYERRWAEHQMYGTGALEDDYSEDSLP